MAKKRTQKPEQSALDKIEMLLKEMEIENGAATPEPSPIANAHPFVLDLVEQDLMVLANVPFEVGEDLAARSAFGEKKYGTKLQPFNGRDPINDLYQELLDAVMYNRQAIYQEQKNPLVKLAREHQTIGPELGAIYRKLLLLVGEVSTLRRTCEFLANPSVESAEELS